MTEADIESLVTKSAKAEKSEDAMRFSQAAVNASQALLNLLTIRNNVK